jgi:hypothetical protein
MAAMAGEPTIKEFILSLLGSANRKFEIDEIYNEFETADYEAPRSSIRGRLNSLANEGRIRRVARATYASLAFEEVAPLYNLIMTAREGEWEYANEKSGSAKILRSRFLEHTDKDIAEQFRSLNPAVLQRLLEIPSLFAYEVGVASAARVGRLLDIHVQAKTLEIWFEFDPSVPAISPEKFSEILERLGVGNAEQQRTHWAIKNIDLYFEILASDLVNTELEAIPPEPPSGPGPQYRPRDGKLSEVPSLPAEDEAARQSNLHRLLQRDAAILAKSLQRAVNRTPNSPAQRANTPNS